MTPDDLRQWCDDNGLSYRQLAREIGVHYTTIDKWLRGLNPVPSWLPLVLWFLEEHERVTEGEATTWYHTDRVQPWHGAPPGARMQA